MCKKIVVAVCVLLFLSLSIIACGEKKKMEAEAIKAAPLQVFEQEITSPAPPQTLNVGESVIIPVTVKNTGNEPWPCKGIDKKNTNGVRLGFHWLDNSGKTIQEGRAPLFPHDISPGSSVSLEAKAQAPSEPGDYTLRFSVVQEQVAWFHKKGAVPFIINIKVQ